MMPKKSVPKNFNLACALYLKILSSAVSENKLLFCKFVNTFSYNKKFCALDRGPRYHLDTSALDIFGKSVPIRNFKKRYNII